MPRLETVFSTFLLASPHHKSVNYHRLLGLEGRGVQLKEFWIQFARLMPQILSMAKEHIPSWEYLPMGESNLRYLDEGKHFLVFETFNHPDKLIKLFKPCFGSDGTTAAQEFNQALQTQNLIREKYSSIPSCVTEEYPFMFETSLPWGNRRKVFGVVQEKHHIFQDLFGLDANHLHVLTKSDQNLSDSLRRFASITCDDWNQNNGVLDILGKNNVIITRHENRSVLKIIDSRSWITSEQMLGKSTERQECLRERLKYLSNIGNIISPTTHLVSSISPVCLV